MIISHASLDGALFRKLAFDDTDKVEEAGKLHFEWLQVEVFQPLQIKLGNWDANALHGHAISRLHHIAQAGSEKCKSICFGLAYAFVALEWCDDAEIDYLQYLTLVQSLDDSEVLIRTLCALSHRIRSLHEQCRSRFFSLLEHLIDSRCAKIHLAVEILQRELRPGSRQLGTAELLTVIAHLNLRHVEWLKMYSSTARLTFLWAMRWASAFDQQQSSGLEDASGRLRQEMLQLAAALWDEARQPICDAGPLFLWALLHVRNDPEWVEAWQCASTGEICEHFLNQATPHACLDHMLSDSEYEQLHFILQGEDIANHQEVRYCQWFAAKHLGDQANTIHLADIILWCLMIAEQTRRPRPNLWAWLWKLSLSGGHSQAELAFLFAARNPGYAREALSSAIAGADVETRVRLQKLADASLPRAAADGLRCFLSP